MTTPTDAERRELVARLDQAVEDPDLRTWELMAAAADALRVSPGGASVEETANKRIEDLAFDLQIANRRLDRYQKADKIYGVSPEDDPVDLAQNLVDELASYKEENEALRASRDRPSEEKAIRGASLEEAANHIDKLILENGELALVRHLVVTAIRSLSQEDGR